MTKRFLVWAQLLFLLQLPFLLHAQEHKQPVFGAPTPQELSMTVYEKDSSAQAVVLSDSSRMEFFTTKGYFKTRLKRYVRIKVLGRQGYDAAQVSIPVYRYRRTGEALCCVEGITYNQEGGSVVATKLDASQVFRQEDGYYTTYKFAMPRVKEGSVIVYSYELTSDYLRSLPPWEYQGGYPVVRSIYQAVIPHEYTYNYRRQGDHRVHISTHDSTRVYVAAGKFRMRVLEVCWAVSDVPAMKSEPLMAPIRTLLGRMDFEKNKEGDSTSENDSTVVKDWAAVDKFFLAPHERFGKYLKENNDFASSLSVQLAQAAYPDTLERIGRIAALLRERVKWNGSRGVLASEMPGKVLKEGTGNSTALNLLLITALRKQGISCWPLLVPDREEGVLDSTFTDIDRVMEALVLVRLGDAAHPRLLVVDASDKALPIGLVPPRAYSGYGWIYGAEGMSPWYPLEPLRPGQVKLNATVKVEEDGSMQGQVAWNLDGYPAYRLRRQGAITQEQGEEQEPNAGKISELQVIQEQDVQKPLRMTYRLEMEPGDKVLCTDRRIDLLPLLSYAEDIDIFKLPKREYPIDLGSPVHYHYTLTFELPEGYMLNSAPAPVSMALPDKSARSVYRLSQEGNILSVSWQLQLNKTRYTPAEYAALREFAIRVSAKLQEMVSLQKVKQ